MAEKYQLFIDGKWRDSSTGETFPAINPFLQETWATIPQSTTTLAALTRRTASDGALFGGAGTRRFVISQ